MATSNHIAEQGSSRRRWAAVLIIVIAVVVLTAFLSLRPRRIRVQVTHPDREDITSSISTNGKMEAALNFEAHAPSPTTVKRILVEVGTRARKGQLLLELDDSDARALAARALAQIRAAEATLATVRSGGNQEEILTRRADVSKAQTERSGAQRNLEALQRLKQRGAASDAEVQVAQDRLNRTNADTTLLEAKSKQRFSSEDIARVQADLVNAQATYNAAKKRVAEANVTAPFDGTVYFLPLREGAFVNTGEMLLQLADLSKMQVRAFIDEPEIGRLQRGQVVRVGWDAVPGRSWLGAVTAVPSTVISRGTRVVGEIICLVNNSDLKLLPNVNVSVTVVTSSRQNALAIPREAIREQEGKHYIFIVDGSHLRKQMVETGVANLTHIEVTQGLTDNQTIAVTSLSPTPLFDGASVKIE